MLLHRQLKAGVLTQDIFLIREKGKSKIIIEPEETLGLFEEKKVLETLRTIGLRTHRYCTTNRTTFSLRKYQGKGTPVFVCEKPL
jgi:hypothetical protein